MDAEDYDRLMTHKYHIRPSKNGKSPYPVRNVTNAKGSRVKRCIAYDVLQFEPVEGMCIDHINGDVLDNRKANLRLADFAQNSQNKTPHGEGSKFNGVYKASHGHSKPWVMSITQSFYTEVEAAHCWDRTAMKFLGHEAEYNFPKEGYTQYVCTNKKKASRYKGVFKNTSNKKKCWKMTFVICCATEEEAARLYDEVASFLFGAFAKLNFPEVA